jgi:small subunit ribosomal protein S3
MGKKVNPIAIRLGVNKGWKSVWYAKKGEFGKVLGEDLKIRKVVTDAMKASGIDSLTISRNAGRIEIELYVARPGVAIGRGGAGIDELQKKLGRMTKAAVEVKIKEIKKPDLSARVIARTIADGIERRQPPKLLMAAAKEKAMLAGATGIRIQVGGRINNATQARKIKDADGAVPLQTLRAAIDYAEETAETGDAGLFGVKVWVYKPETNEETRR